MMILGCVWWKLHEKTKEKFMIHVLYGFHRYYHRCLIDRLEAILLVEMIP